MSHENVEVVRRGFEAYARGDFETVLEGIASDVFWNPAEEEPTHGVAAVREYFERWGSAWEELETTPEEFIDAGDHVVATVHFRGRGRDGIEVDARSYAIYTLRDGKTVRMEEFTDRSEALAVAGLSD